MKVLVLCSSVLLAVVWNAYGQGRAVLTPRASACKFGMGVQVASSSNLFLFSWQGKDMNSYGRSWRIEPMIGFSSTDNETPNYHSTSESLTLGLGYYLCWRVRAPFDNLFFSMGPRALITGYRSSSSNNYSSSVSSSGALQHLSSNLSFLIGPEYALDKWGLQDFIISGFFSYGAAITGYSHHSGYATAGSWSLTTSTSAGIVLRYYFE